MNVIRVIPLLIIIQATSFAQSFQEDRNKASLDIRTIPKTDWHDYRYFSFSSVPLKILPSVPEALSFWCNSLSTSTKIYHPKLITPTLYRVQLSWYGWNWKAWDELSKEENYLGIRNPLVMRGDFFLYHTSDATISDSYYRFLYDNKTPANAKDFYDRWGANQKKTRKFQIEVGYAIEDGQSGVAASNRLITTNPTLFRGDIWQTHDTKTNVGNKRLPENLIVVDPKTLTIQGYKPDGGEIIGNLPNGLQTYLLVNAANDKVDVADPELVTAPDLYTPRRCVDCHGTTGMLPPKHFIPKWIKDGVTFQFVSKKEKQWFETFYLSDNGAILQGSINRYKSALELISGKENPSKCVDNYLNLIRYYEKSVTIQQAALELATTPQEIQKQVKNKVVFQNSIVGLAAGNPIPRDYWEKEGYQVLKGILRDEPIIKRKVKK